MNKIRVSIIIRDNENDSSEAFVRAINRFKKKVVKEGLLRLYKDKRCYKKPSEIRHQKAQELERKRRK